MPNADRIPQIPIGRRWTFRLLLAVALPLVLLGGAEAGLRLLGYGYSTSFFKRATIGGKDYFVENNQFGLRFFPPSLARMPGPVLLTANKATNCIRVFIFGESAALGDPQPNFGAGRYLEALLRARFPQHRFEIVNTAVTAINSHAILPIARECARHEGDIWVVYMGNNEMVGPFGAATVFGAQAPPLQVVRCGLLLQETRLGQLLARCGQKLRRKSASPSGWHGMEMFLGHQVPPNDPRRDVVYRSFGRNLEDILRAGLRSGAGIVLSTVAVNLKDCPPFAFWEGTNFVAGEGARLEQLRREARAFRDTGGFAEAVSRYQAATELSPLSADLHYRLGQCLLQLTNAAAASQFQLAVDTDSLPFRADSRVNELIQGAARKFAGQNLVWCDAAAALAAAEPGGIAGEETFFEHVHLNFRGNYCLARAWAQKIQEQLAGRLGSAAGTNWLSQETCEQLLGLTDWNRVSVLEEVARRMQQPPFKNQPDNDARLANLNTQITACRARMNSSSVAQAAQVYETALASAPDDYRLHENFAEYLEATHDQRASTELEKVCKLIPHFYFPYYRLGLVLKDQGRLDQALEALKQAAALHPSQSEVRLELGTVYARLSRWDSSLTELEHSRQLNPEEPRVHLYLGEVLWKLGRRSDSLQRLQQAIRLRPDYWEAHYRLGEERAQQEDLSGAVEEFVQTLRFNPNYVRAHVNLGVAFFRLGRTQEAVEQFDEALHLEPQNRQAAEFKQRALRDPRPRN